MHACDVMTPEVIHARPEMSIREAAALLAKHSISALPVLDSDGKLVGIVSEGDLLRRYEISTGDRHRSWWLQLLTSNRELASEYVKEHGRSVKDVMTAEVVTVYEDTPLADIAEVLERHRIKRVPVMKNGRMTGIVSRANLVRALAGMDPLKAPACQPRDVELRDAVLAAAKGKSWAPTRENVIVTDGVVHLWGFITSDEESHALCIAARNVPGVKQVVSHLTYPPPPLPL